MTNYNDHYNDQYTYYNECFMKIKNDIPGFSFFQLQIFYVLTYVTPLTQLSNQVRTKNLALLHS